MAMPKSGSRVIAQRIRGGVMLPRCDKIEIGRCCALKKNSGTMKYTCSDLFRFVISTARVAAAGSGTGSLAGDRGTREGAAPPTESDSLRGSVTPSEAPSLGLSEGRGDRDSGEPVAALCRCAVT